MISAKDLDSTLATDAYLPAQYASDRAPMREGPHRLWYHVLDQAIHSDLFSPKEPVRRRARQWFESRIVSVGSFEWICQHLDLPAGLLRDTLLRMEERPKSHYRRGAGPKHLSTASQRRIQR